jgi:thiol-disulfide isomerase/thioredoxin
MPAWLRYTLLVLVIISSGIIGISVYLDLNRSAHTTERPNVTVVDAPMQMPEFSLRDTNGDLQSISQWSNQAKLINFWATWCAPCRREMPLLQTLHTEQVHTGIQVIGVAIDRQADVQSYLAESGVTYPILWGEGDALVVSDMFGVTELALPFTVLVSANDEILGVHIGELSRNQLAKMADISARVAAGEISAVDARQRLATL